MSTEEAATKGTIGGGSGGITKSEMMSEMRIMIQELMGLGLIGAKANTNPSELKLKLVPEYLCPCGHSWQSYQSCWWLVQQVQ